MFRGYSGRRTMNAEGQKAVLHGLSRPARADGLSISAMSTPLARPVTHLHHVEPYLPPLRLAEEPASVDLLWSRVEPYLVRGLHERWIKPVLDRVLAVILLLVALPILVLA